MADLVEIRDFGRVVDIAQSAKGVDRLVLGALQRQGFVASLAYGGELAASDEAALAGTVLDVEALRHGLRADLLPVRHRTLRPIAAGEGLRYIDGRRCGRCAHAAEGPHASALTTGAAQVAVVVSDPLRVEERSGSVPVEDDALDSLGTEDGSHAGAPGCVSLVVAHGGEPHLVLASRADDDALGPVHTHVLLQRLLRRVQVEAPEGGRVVERRGLGTDL